MRIDGNTPVDALYHSDDELMHWKYVKRVKKNGKWKYYYDWDELKKDTKNFVSDPTGSRAKNNLKNAQQRTLNAQNNISGRKMSDIHYRAASKGNGPETTSVNNRAVREKAVNAYRRDQVDLAVAKANEKKAREAYNNTVAGKTENTIKAISDSVKTSIEGAKQKIDDALGKDEKAYRDYAYKQLDKRKATLDYTSGSTFIVNGKEVKTDWVEEYTKAQKEYMKTPIGKIEAAGDAIKKATDWLKSLIGDNKKSEESAVKTETTADKAVKKAEEGLDLAKKRENYTKNQQAKLQSQLTNAKTAADKGKERWEKAKKDYEESSKVDYELFKKARDQKDALNKMTDGPGKEAAQKAYDKIYNEWLDAYNESARLQNNRDREYNAYQQLQKSITQIEDRIEKEKNLPDSAAKNRRDAEYEQELAKTLKEYEEELEKLRKK